MNFVTVPHPVAEKLAQLEHKSTAQPVTTTSSLGNPVQVIPHQQERDRLSSERPDRIKQEREDNPAAAGYGQPGREVREPPPPPQESKPWGYSGIDLMNTGAAFWQNYSGEFSSVQGDSCDAFPNCLLKIYFK